MESLRFRFGRPAALASIVLAIFACGNACAARPPGTPGSLRSYPVPSGARPAQIVRGPGRSVWFTEPFEAQLGRVLPSGEITEYPIPGESAGLGGLAGDSSGRLWFTEPKANKIAAMTPGGEINEFLLPSDEWHREVGAITTGPGFMWFAVSRGSRPFPPYSNERSPAKIGEITPTGQVTEFSLPDDIGEPHSLATDAKGDLWFTEDIGVETGGGQVRIQRVTPGGEFSEKTLSGEAWPGPITLGPDGDMWLGEQEAGPYGRIIRVSPDWNVKRFPPPGMGGREIHGGPEAITRGPDGDLWFTERDPSIIGRIDPQGDFAQMRLPEPASAPKGIVAGREGNLWFTQWRTSQISRITPMDRRHSKR